MELSKDQVARIASKDVDSLFKASSNSKKVLQDFVENDDRYTYDIQMNYDELYYDIFLYRKNNKVDE